MNIFYQKLNIFLPVILLFINNYHMFTNTITVNLPLGTYCIGDTRSILEKNDEDELFVNFDNDNKNFDANHIESGKFEYILNERKLFFVPINNALEPVGSDNRTYMFNESVAIIPKELCCKNANEIYHNGKKVYIMGLEYQEIASSTEITISITKGIMTLSFEEKKIIIDLNFPQQIIDYIEKLKNEEIINK